MMSLIKFREPALCFGPEQTHRALGPIWYKSMCQEGRLHTFNQCVSRLVDLGAPVLGSTLIKIPLENIVPGDRPCKQVRASHL